MKIPQNPMEIAIPSAFLLEICLAQLLLLPDHPSYFYDKLKINKRILFDRPLRVKQETRTEQEGQCNQSLVMCVL